MTVDELSNVKIFKAHSTILRYRSSYFRNELANLSKDKNNIKILDLNDISIQIFINRDDLQMEEVKIWNRVIEWGIAQNPGLPSDSEN
ncbi:hypothetical protein C2G38_2177849 [Gigaspora rosea]|uniref:BTB domain-containing protein n=1 Tax=Gigaspora rosea TaxID=44941 RepID=A0A397VEW7_9GLOM|nr:hypothetical protein C2G38_2177849 [Gigaspora rosea]